MNWNKFSNQIKIEGKVYNNLPHNIETKFAKVNWLNHNVDFIKEFVSPQDFITVKTSGSTGIPKSIKLKKSTLVASALNTGEFLDLKKDQSAFLCLPGNYIAGKMMIVRTFVLGLDLYWQKPGSRPDIERDYDFAAMTPMQVENILKTDKSALNRIKKLIIGGASVNEYIHNEIQDLETQIYESYGMTETASHIALKKLNGKDKSDYFTVLNKIEIGIDLRSCLVLNKSNLHVKNIVTNDIVELKDSKQFKWLGRADNIINSGGVKIIPELIEKKLKPFLKNEFFIFAIEDEKYGQLPAIIIEGKKSDKIPDFSILNRFEIPRKVFYIDKLIRTDSGKVDRRRTVGRIIV